MGLPKTIRFNDELEKKVEKYLKNNRLKLAQLVNMAVDKFITEPQSIQLKPVKRDDFMATAEKAFKKHKKAMDKLK